MAKPTQPDFVQGPIPDDNLPGHHPEIEADKPARRPSVPPVDHRFAFDFDSPLRYAARAVGVTERSAFVQVVGDTLAIRFGPWVLQTMTSNVVDADVTGPYAWWKVAGPPRLSFADRGITFATTTGPGVCLRFGEPVGGVLPVPWLRHPGATVTVQDPQDLVRILT